MTCSLFVKLTELGQSTDFFKFREVRWNTQSQVWQEIEDPQGITHEQLGEALERTGSGDIGLIGNVVKLDAIQAYNQVEEREERIYTFRGNPLTAFFARITGSTSISANRWQYTFSEVRYKKAGQWAVIAHGRTGIAYNTMEESNTKSGVQGDGTDVSNYPAGVSLQPIGTAVVEMREVVNCETGETEYVFSATNNPDGSCPG